MSLNSVPTEIVLLILDCIDTVAILRNFYLNSRKFRGIAQPLIYREIILSAEYTPQSLLLLCRTIITCPRIAA
jgi:hypothetical protein